MVKKTVKTILEWIIYAIIFIAIVWGTPKALAKILHTPYPIAAITSGSMWPVLKQGDMIFIRGINSKDEIKINDIVVYKNIQGFTIHRVVKINDDTLITKGDANNIEDSPVNYEQIIGKTVVVKGVILRIPYLGNLSQTLRPKVL